MWFWLPFPNIYSFLMWLLIICLYSSVKYLLKILSIYSFGLLVFTIDCILVLTQIFCIKVLYRWYMYCAYCLPVCSFLILFPYWYFWLRFLKIFMKIFYHCFLSYFWCPLKKKLLTGRLQSYSPIFSSREIL